ncbi:MAG: hypothetical protein ABIQ51_05865, partial [Mesorhizobium sp.]
MLKLRQLPINDRCQQEKSENFLFAGYRHNAVRSIDIETLGAALLGIGPTAQKGFLVENGDRPRHMMSMP